MFFNMKEYKFVVTLKIWIFFSSVTALDGYNNKKNDLDTKINTDIPVSMAADILTILINGTVHLAGNCTADSDGRLTQHWLYTQANRDGELLVDVENIVPTKAVIILLHGWGGYKNITYIAVIIDAYLQRYDANIISIDYGAYAQSDYQSAYCNGPSVARNVANFICRLKTQLGIFIPSIHVVGHSLGGQIAGMVGKGTQDTCNEIIGRITGLDAAGPLYEGINPSFRLDKTDAAFVDVLHTNQGQYGYIGQLGHVDFYANGGMIQPGCSSVLTNFTVLANLTANTITSYPLSFVTCNHQRSCYLFAESINTNSFYSNSVLQCFGICVPDFVSPTHCYMGENLRAPPPGGDTQYSFNTNDKPKYGLGPDGPLT